ncbi:MAG: signal peptidase I [Chloroflexi bacterium]|nr:signal peptidase I [Chloroflexota bacterium]
MPEVPTNDTAPPADKRPEPPLPEREERVEHGPASTPGSSDSAAQTGPFGPLGPSTNSSPPADTDTRSEAPVSQQPTTPTPTPERPLPRPIPVRMHTTPPPAEPPVREAPGTTGVPHYSPPATTDRLFGGPAAVAAPPRRSIVRPLGRGLREIAETIILALLIFLMVRAVVQNFQVEGSSMNPTFESEWYVLVNKSLYWEINLDTVSKFIPFVDPGDDPTRYIFRGPKRGDVIVFRSPTVPEDAPERDFIKRIIGLPGETIEVHDCTVFIDGLPLDEPYIKEKPRYTFGPETIPPDHYFVLGDNRNNSSDSHSWGPLPKENLIGQAWLIYWPRSAFGLVDNTSVTPMEPEPLPEPFQDVDPIICPGG